MKANWSTLPPLPFKWLFSSLFLILFFPSPIFANQDKVLVTASIGTNQVTITGYTSPNSAVELTSSKVFSVTYSDSTGFFIFNRTILPKNPGELCLSSIDNSSRRSTPVCIPAPPPTNYHTNIGLIILPPTLTLDNSQIKPNSTTLASGQSLPHATVTIHFYQVDSHPGIFPQVAQAFGLPEFKVTSDSTGNYSFSLPTTYSSDYRLYSTVDYQSQPSPKSNTLLYKLPSLFWLFWQQNGWLVITLIIFVLFLTFIFYLIYHRFSFKPPTRFLPALFSYPLVKINRGQQ